jgi:hypothetical protein
MFKKNFEQRTNSFLSVFTKMVDGLDKMNQEINEENRLKEEKIKTLQDEIHANSRVYYKNDVIKSNINKILAG